MDIQIVGRHAKVNEEIRTKITEKIENLEVLAPGATAADVHVVHERNPHRNGDRERVEITLHDHGVIRVEAGADDRMVALDAAIAKLTEQLRRRHERKAHRHQHKLPLHAVPLADDLPPLENDPLKPRVESVEAWDGAPEDSTREVQIDDTPITIRSKTHEGTPMSVTEAIDQMELVGHDFYLFHDADSGLPSAVYRRRGWTYGVIHLDEAPAQAASIDREAKQESA
jgi:ribosomal subunit interface protein